MEPAGPKPILAPAGMSAMDSMPDEASVVTENGVWYIGNIGAGPRHLEPRRDGVRALHGLGGRAHGRHAELGVAGVHERHVLHGAARDFAAARQPELFRHEVGPAGAVAEVGAALRGGADREALGPAGAIGVLGVNAAARQGDEGGGGESAMKHVSPPMESGCPACGSGPACMPGARNAGEPATPTGHMLRQRPGVFSGQTWRMSASRRVGGADSRQGVEWVTLRTSRDSGPPPPRTPKRCRSSRARWRSSPPR